MSRKLFSPLVLVLAAAVALAPAAHAQGNTSTLLMPGVTYSKRVQFTPHGPVVLNVITAPKPGGLYSLEPVLSNDALIAREKVTDIEKRLSPTSTVAGVNGDLFAGDGRPAGVVIRDGVLEHPPDVGRTSVGITNDGTVRNERVGMVGYWRGTGQRQRVGLNDPPTTDGFSLFTPAYGPRTPSATGVAEVVLQPFPAVTPNTDLTGTVVSVAPPTAGNTAIPPDGAVLQARGAGATRLISDAPVGTTVTVRYTLNPTWDGVAQALGGGPLIVSNGTPVFRANEDFNAAQLAQREPRTAIGQRADGKILLVAVDGGQPGYSVGVTNFELALALMQLGAVTASALDGGDSTTMAFDGQLLSNPGAKGGEIPVSEALLVAYGGVYVPPPAEPVLSPNGDGVAETQSLAYKVVRPSTVQASLVGPDNATIPLDSGQRAPGTYRFAWAGKEADGSAAPEGTWRFTVTATDDRGQASTADRAFTLNNTLATLAVRPSLLLLRAKNPRLTASFQLEQAAKIIATVETSKGVVVRVLARKQLAAGSRSLAWDGKVGGGGIAYGGSYQLHVAAVNALGRVDLYAPFTARR